MKYNQDTAVREILHRSNILRKKKERIMVRVLCASSAALFALLVLSIGIVFRDASLDPEQSVFGSFLLPTEAGGYVLAALIAFIAGVAVTLIIHRSQEKKKQEEKNDKDDKSENNSVSMLEDDVLFAAAGGKSSEPNEKHMDKRNEDKNRNEES